MTTPALAVIAIALVAATGCGSAAVIEPGTCVPLIPISDEDVGHS